MIDPQELDLSQLPWLPLDARAAFPRNPAIYFAIDGKGTIQYIGRTIDPKQRWLDHHCYKDLASLDKVKIAYLFVDTPEFLPKIESALIEWFNPKLNFVLNMRSQSNKLELQALKVAQLLIKLREKAGLTQRQVANALNVTDQTVSNWETGQRTPRLSPSQMLKLCHVLQCTLEELAEQ